MTGSGAGPSIASRRPGRSAGGGRRQWLGGQRGGPMPGLVAFRRRWSIGSDDLAVPGAFFFLLHAICCQRPASIGLLYT
ncbi:Sn1-specific diacylglycerol lipase alpha [Amphibalanus amphitrite]|uniref:Sn1-specific diacylglycerol lipase alpha n=1 Tax=Amphibalanus amphitrite TaxID=1232801 RepID=A0A6A4WUU1_AMPAM|nr:Sn1-specific diacylglycerol lipase alpha [Amphibalanus amphitrite]